MQNVMEQIQDAHLKRILGKQIIPMNLHVIWKSFLLTQTDICVTLIDVDKRIHTNINTYSGAQA